MYRKPVYRSRVKRSGSGGAVRFARWCPDIGALCLALVAIGCSSGGEGGGSDGFIGSFTSDNLNLDITVQTIVVPADRRPIITFTITDDAGADVLLSEMTDIRFILAVLERISVGSPFEFRSYSTEIEDPDGIPNTGDEAIQAAYDPARLDGVTVNPDGLFSYKFATAMAAGFDRTATHQLGGQFTRFSEADQMTYRANLAMPFRLDGLPVTETRDIVSTQACNDCHTRLSEHGNTRREVQLCILCHSSQTVDAETGNLLHFAEMIHKIHRAADLDSFLQEGEPYQISGFGDIIYDYSTIQYPQEIQNCISCHAGASNAGVFEDAPTFRGCVSCHDRVWHGPVDDVPTGYFLHPGGVRLDTSECALCHSPGGNGVAPVDIRHTIPTESDDAPGLALNVIDVFTFPGVSDTGLQIAFTAEDGMGMPITDLSILDTVAATVSYPVPEYETFVRESISSAFGGPDGTLVNNGNGSYLYTFLAEFPTGSPETFSVAMEGRREFTFRGRVFDQGTSTNGQILFTLDTSPPIDRRMVVDDAKCNVCHRETRAHGTLRTGVNLCVMCHNPNTTDESRRPMADLPPVTVSFKDMIHRIHTGEDLAQEYTVFGLGGTPHDFTELRFGGDRRDCSICHVEDTISVPLPPETISTVVTQDDGMTFISEVLPTRAACISCHDDATADSHALSHTDLIDKVETCTVCHSDSDDLSVMNVHLIEP